jgi:predicted Zn-ribbon and HTH transcriptional regulator
VTENLQSELELLENTCKENGYDKEQIKCAGRCPDTEKCCRRVM